MALPKRAHGPPSEGELRALKGATGLLRPFGGRLKCFIDFIEDSVKLSERVTFRVLWTFLQRGRKGQGWDLCCADMEGCGTLENYCPMASCARFLLVTSFMLGADSREICLRAVAGFWLRWLVSVCLHICCVVLLSTKHVHRGLHQRVLCAGSSFVFVGCCK